MTIKRAALYIGGASLLVAWLSSAASVALNPAPPRAAPQSIEEPPVDLAAAQVLERARRLKERLAATPPLEEPTRNPFAFRPVERRPAPTARKLRAAVVQPETLAPAEPRLMLVGVSEDRKPEGPVRTAMLATDSNELIVAAVGDIVLGRYAIKAISLEAVEMADQATGAIRRIALQAP
ncbi:MAG: hypothetical protein ACRD1U_04690 [Vicinamibacterales bacterium]